MVSADRVAQTGRDRVEVVARGLLTGAEAHGQTIPGVARQHVQVRVEDLLPGDLAVGKEEVHALGQPELELGGGDPAAETHHLGGVFVVEVAEPDGVVPGDHQRVALGEGEQVEEGDRPLLGGDDRGLGLAGDDRAEDAVHGLRP